MNSIYKLMDTIDDKESLNEKYNVRNLRNIKTLHETTQNVTPESPNDFGFKVMFDGYPPYIEYFHGTDRKFDNHVLNSREGIIEFVKWFHYDAFRTGDYEVDSTVVSSLQASVENARGIVDWNGHTIWI